MMAMHCYSLFLSRMNATLATETRFFSNPTSRNPKTRTTGTSLVGNPNILSSEIWVFGSENSAAVLFLVNLSLHYKYWSTSRPSINTVYYSVPFCSWHTPIYRLTRIVGDSVRPYCGWSSNSHGCICHEVIVQPLSPAQRG